MERKEAIEVVKNNWPNGRVQLSEALMTLIPELKESEDEKMIRLIKTALYDQSDVLAKYYKINNITEEEIFAWLEKQGKNEHTWSKEDERMIDSIIEKLRPYGECSDHPEFEELYYYSEREKMINWLESIKSL